LHPSSGRYEGGDFRVSEVDLPGSDKKILSRRITVGEARRLLLWAKLETLETLGKPDDDNFAVELSLRPEVAFEMMGKGPTEEDRKQEDERIGRAKTLNDPLFEELIWHSESDDGQTMLIRSTSEVLEVITGDTVEVLRRERDLNDEGGFTVRSSAGEAEEVLPCELVVGRHKEVRIRSVIFRGRMFAVQKGGA
jgi:hypothetical protein